MPEWPSLLDTVLEDRVDWWDSAEPPMVLGIDFGLSVGDYTECTVAGVVFGKDETIYRSWGTMFGVDIVESRMVPRNSLVAVGPNGTYRVFNVGDPSWRASLDVVLDPEPDWWRGGKELDGDDLPAQMAGGILDLPLSSASASGVTLWSTFETKNPCCEIWLSEPSRSELEPMSLLDAMLE